MHRHLQSAALAAAVLTTAASPAIVSWTPDLVHSRAEFTVSHMVLSKVWGHVPIRSISLQTAGTSVIPTQIDAVLDVTHEDTDNHLRDEDLRSETYFDVAHYPTMTFHSTKIVANGPDDAVVSGTITIKNVTKSLEFPIHVVGRIPDAGGTRVGYTGELHIDRRDFGIVDNRLTSAGVLLVGYDVTIGLTVEATNPNASYLKTAQQREDGPKTGTFSVTDTPKCKKPRTVCARLVVASYEGGRERRSALTLLPIEISDEGYLPSPSASSESSFTVAAAVRTGIEPRPVMPYSRIWL